MNKQADFIGDNLKLARMMSEMTLSELGETLSVSRQYIHKLENSDTVPTQEVVAALAWELGVKPKFFYEDLYVPITRDECHFRSVKSAKVSSKRACQARATLLSAFVSELERVVELPEVTFPEFNIEPDLPNAVEILASRVREHFGLSDGPIKSLTRVVENAGVLVTSFGDLTEKVDALSIHRRRPLIILNSNKSRSRIRMDIAHEFGHLVMHRGIETGDMETENQANRFASALLLPSHKLAEEYDNRNQRRLNWDSIYKIKVKWGISAQAIVYKLNQVGLISPSMYKRANIYFSKTGQRKMEWSEDNVFEEYSTILDESLKLLHQSEYNELLNELLERSTFTSKLLKEITNSTVFESFNFNSKRENVLELVKAG